MAAWLMIRGGAHFGWLAPPMSIGFDRIVEAGGYINVNTGAPPDANEIPVPKDAADAASKMHANSVNRVLDLVADVICTTVPPFHSGSH